MSFWEGIGYAAFAKANPKNKTVAKLRRKLRLPNHAGIIESRKNRASGTTIGLYHSAESGLELDPALPYSTVCETHGNIVCHETLASARQSMSQPDWCEDCQEIMNAKEKDRHGR